MNKSKIISIYFLSGVYLLLLVSIIFPHHHHEEIICYTSTHCETDSHSEENSTQRLEDHHHDHNTSEETEHCNSVDYYILSGAGKNLKQSVTQAENHLFEDVFLSVLFNNETVSWLSYSYNFPFLKSHYIVSVKQHIPLRGPPAIVA